MKNVTRSEILDTAKEYVTKDRAAQHGDMESNLTNIAKLWSVFLEVPIEPHQVGVCMTLLKMQTTGRTLVAIWRVAGS